jgi:uncharacterized protein with PQ loop repeat
MIDALGWIGAWILAFCMLPELLYAFKHKTARMLLPTLVFWFLGLFSMAVYTVLKLGWDWQLMFNFGLNCIIAVFLIYYKIRSKFK